MLNHFSDIYLILLTYYYSQKQTNFMADSIENKKAAPVVVDLKVHYPPESETSFFLLNNILAIPK
jgi:hypothetical protein